jgi:molecular chaperone Hsp33
MSDRQPAGPPSRPVSDRGRDDTVLPFSVEQLDVRGRVVRLGPSVDAILARHSYPAPVARVVGEALALTILLGSSLKIDGRFQLQTRGDGAIDMLVVDFDAPDRLRAFARFDAARLAAAPKGQDLLGSGHLAFTIDQGGDAARYQGIVALDGQGLEDAAHQYFRQSEQIPTQIRLAVAQSMTAAGISWRAGGLMIQFLPGASERRRIELAPGDAPDGTAYEPPPEDDAWAEAKAIAATVEDHELVDPMLSSERLLYRLFHQPGVKVFEPRSVQNACRCSDDGVRAMLRGFPAQDRDEMVGDDGRIGVTCEFCSAFRSFDPKEFEG